MLLMEKSLDSSPTNSLDDTNFTLITVAFVERKKKTKFYMPRAETRLDR